MHFGHSQGYGTYTLGEATINSVQSLKDLGILSDSHLEFHLVATKANHITWFN